MDQFTIKFVRRKSLCFPPTALPRLSSQLKLTIDSWILLTFDFDMIPNHMLYNIGLGLIYCKVKHRLLNIKSTVTIKELSVYSATKDTYYSYNQSSNGDPWYSLAKKRNAREVSQRNAKGDCKMWLIAVCFTWRLKVAKALAGAETLAYIMVTQWYVLPQQLLKVRGRWLLLGQSRNIPRNLRATSG